VKERESERVKSVFLSHVVRIDRNNSAINVHYCDNHSTWL